MFKLLFELVYPSPRKTNPGVQAAFVGYFMSHGFAKNADLVSHLSPKCKLRRDGGFSRRCRDVLIGSDFFGSHEDAKARRKARSAKPL